MKRRILFVVAVVTALLGGSLPAINVNADEMINSLTLSPQNQKILLVPGETFEGAIKISSQASSNTPTEYQLLVGPFREDAAEGAKDDYGKINVTDVTSYNQIMDWIKLDRTEGKVSPNETQVVPFRIEVPESAPAGGQYATIILRDANPGVSRDSGVTVNSVFQIVSIIYAEVAGESKEVGEVFSNEVPAFLLQGPLETTSIVKNSGNVHADAQFTLQVWSLFSDEEICTNEENPDISLIMPETERYHAQTCDLPSVGIFRAKQTVKIFDKTSTVDRMVIICPLWLLFLILFIIIALILWIVMKLKARSKRNSRRESGE